MKHHFFIKSSPTASKPTKADIRIFVEYGKAYEFSMLITISATRFISFFVDSIQEDEFSNQTTKQTTLERTQHNMELFS